MENVEAHSETDWRGWFERLERREPNKSRYYKFYKGLDASVPNWMSIIVSPSFMAWGMDHNFETNSCMLDMLYALWNDPAYNSEQFATIIRLFISETDSHFRDRQSIGNTLQHLLGQEPKSGNSSSRLLLSGRYEVLRKLGRGGNGDVFLAWSHETLSLYGLKVIRKELCDDRDVVNRFKNEI